MKILAGPIRLPEGSMQPSIDIGVDLSKRNFLKAGGTAGLGALVLGTTACPGGKNLSFWVSTIVGTLEELKPLLPNLSEPLSRGISIAKSFDEAYREGKFEDAEAIFENLHGVITQIITDAGISLGDNVKISLALLSVGLRTVSVILKAQLENPQVAAAVKNRAQSNPASARRLKLIDSLASPKEVNAVFEAARP